MLSQYEQTLMERHQVTVDQILHLTPDPDRPISTVADTQLRLVLETLESLGHIEITRITPLARGNWRMEVVRV